MRSAGAHNSADKFAQSTCELSTGTRALSPRHPSSKGLWVSDFIQTRAAHRAHPPRSIHHLKVSPCPRARGTRPEDTPPHVASRDGGFVGGAGVASNAPFAKDGNSDGGAGRDCRFALALFDHYVGACCGALPLPLDALPFYRAMPADLGHSVPSGPQWV